MHPDLHAATALSDEGVGVLEVFEQAPGFLCFLSGKRLEFKLANAAYYQLVGHRSLLGRTVRDALPDIAGQGFFELLDGVWESGMPHVGRGTRLTLQREPGEPPVVVYIDFIYQPILDKSGQVSGILVQGHDVTEAHTQEAGRLAAEKALQLSAQRLRSLFESIDDGFCVMEMLVDASGETVDYRFLAYNPAFESHTGLRDALGKTARELVPDLDPSWFKLYGEVAKTGVTKRFENHAPAMGRWFDVYASRVGDPALRQVALVFKNVSEIKKAELERERILASEKQARADAERANHLKDEFLATISHELRTPLNAILGWTVLLRQGLPQDKHERAISTIERNARAQAQLIEDLLDVSRIISGKLRLRVRPMDVAKAVEAAIETVRVAADAKGVRLQVVLDDEAGKTVGDLDRLQQVAWNLLSNAIKFTPKGGRVHVSVQRRESSIELRVADDGMGIPAEFLPFVFERFRQADGGSTRPQSGLGLGLSIARHLVELHGGTIAAASDGAGQGSVFTVLIPIAPVRQPEVPLGSRPRSLTPEGDRMSCPPELSGIRVLVVDDEPDARELLEVVLSQCGAHVETVASAQEALRALQDREPDVLVSDIGMPAEDGYSLIRQVRALPAAAGGRVPAIALTAFARLEDRMRALEEGFTSHVAKPVEPRELMAVIAALLGRVTPTP